MRVCTKKQEKHGKLSLCVHVNMYLLVISSNSNDVHGMNCVYTYDIITVYVFITIAVASYIFMYVAFTL